MDRRYDDALAGARSALAIQPGMDMSLNTATQILFSRGMRDELLADRRQWVARDAELAAALERGLAEGGYEGALGHIADIMAARLDKSGRVVAPGGFGGMVVAWLHIYAGQYEKSMDWLEKAFKVHDPNLPYIGEPVYDPLRSKPRSQALLRRMKLRQAEPES
jgi:tetratricopeptide (TPR) repeat protein